MLETFLTDPGASFSPLWYLLARRRFRTWSQKDISKYQTVRLRKIVTFAAARLLFYRKYYAGKDLRDVWNLPVVNKKILMDNLSEVNTLGLTREEIFDFCLKIEKSRDFTQRYKGLNLGMSSGTSGNKGVEITTPREQRYLQASFLARFPFIKGEKMNFAFILRVFTPAFNFNLFGHRVTYVSQLQPIEAIIDQINAIKPNIISGPASVLRLLSHSVVNKNLTTKPKRLVSYAEVLNPEDRILLKNVFGADISEIYKATEGAIAISCAKGSLHINEDLVAVQTLEADGSPTPSGQPCRQLIVTDLHKTSMPIIRYALNDIITISPECCSCGSAFRVISRIQGRGDDMLWAQRPSDGVWQPIFPDYISRGIISASDTVEDYQVVQDAPDHIIVRLQPSGNEALADQVRHAVRAVFTKFNCHKPVVVILWEAPILNERSGKLIRIHRTFPEPKL